MEGGDPLSDAAIATITGCVITVVTMVIGFLTLWIKLRYGKEATEKVGNKVDDNTRITKESAKAAVTSSERAVEAAASAATKADDISAQLNGKLEGTIARIVSSNMEAVHSTLRAHMDQDDKNMAEIRSALTELKDTKDK